MSDVRLKFLCAIAVFISFIAFVGGELDGWRTGKHDADRWYAAHPCQHFNKPSEAGDGEWDCDANVTVAGRITCSMPLADDKGQP